MFDLSRFHKLIRNRVLWLFFLILIIASFVFTYSPNTDQASLLKTGDQTVGKVNGRTVKVEEYHTQSYYAEKSRFENKEEGVDHTTKVLTRIALLDQAADQGLRVSDAELQNMVGSAQMFRNEKGEFEKRAFHYYLMQEKWPSEASFFDFQRQEGTLFKLYELAAGGAQVVSPNDLRDAYDRDYTTYEVEYAKVPRSVLGTNQTEITEAMVEAFYNENKNDFQRPEEVKARFLTITVQDAFNTNLVTAAEAQAYYNEHLATEFTRTVASTNALAATNTTAGLETRAIPFAEVSTNIFMKLGFFKAQEKMKETAYSLYDQMLPRRGFQNQSFDEIQATLRIPVTTTEYFTVNQPIPGIDLGVAASRTVFGLGTNEIDRLAEPMVSSNKAYVVQLLNRRPERVQALAEVKDLVRMRAQIKTRNDQLLEKARELHGKVAEAMKGGQAFSNAVAAVQLVSTNAPAFSRAGGEIRAVPGLFQILNDLDNASPGDLLPPVVAGDGALIARVKEIKPADPAGFEEKKKNYAGGLVQRRYGALIKDYRDYLTRSVKIEKKAKDEGEKPAT